jgi:hypothetical protein
MRLDMQKLVVSALAAKPENGTCPKSCYLCN